MFLFVYVLKDNAIVTNSMSLIFRVNIDIF